MTTLFESNIILTNMSDLYLNNQVGKPYSDLDRLLEPYGTVSLRDSVVLLSWMGGGIFVVPHKAKTPPLTMRQETALEALVKEFKDTSSVEPLVFVFSPVPTAVEFKYFPEEDTYKIYDWFNEMWRKFTLNVKVAGMEVDNNTGVTFTIPNVSMDNKLTVSIHGGKLVEVLEHGSVNTRLEGFTLHTTHDFFKNIVLEPLPKDHPGAVVAVPSIDSQYRLQQFLTTRGNPITDQYGNKVYPGPNNPSVGFQGPGYDPMGSNQKRTW